jgi:excisionase family DNA binding protein
MVERLSVATEVRPSAFRLRFPQVGQSLPIMSRVSGDCREEFRRSRALSSHMDTSESIVPVLLKAREAARALRIGRSTLYELIAASAIEVVQFGRSVRVPSDELLSFVARRRCPSCVLR